MLELRGICAGYGNHVVLRDVDLVVPDRAVVALLGANGAGKSTLLRVAAGQLRPTTGRIFVDDVDATGWSSQRLAQAGICHIPEGRGVFRSLTVRDNVRLQASHANESASLARATTAFPVLGARLRQRAGTLSGGEQQMLALARGYVAAPKTLLLDEVSLGLAPKVVEEIFQHLHALAAQGCALLLVEQYVTRALALADYVYILEKGRIRFVGESSQLNNRTLLASYLGA